jgi:CheY-like chemotaxis protein
MIEQTGKPPFPAKHILVVEDNFDNQELMKDILEELHYKVDVASDGEEAIEKWKNKHYDLILLDIQMPKMDGYQVSLKIREIEKETSHHIPIVALTANVLASDRQKCLQAGMNDYIGKPIDIDIVENKLNEIFSH